MWWDQIEERIKGWEYAQPERLTIQKNGVLVFRGNHMVHTLAPSVDGWICDCEAFRRFRPLGGWCRHTLAAGRILAALGFSGNDILNPTTSAAAAHAKELEIESKSQKDTIDLAAYQAQKAAETEKTNLELENYKAIQTARAQAEQDKLRQETEARQRKLDQDAEFEAQRHQSELAQMERRAQIVNSLLPIMMITALLDMLAIGVGLSYYLIQLDRSRRESVQVQAPSTASWHDPVWRAEQVSRAHTKEVAERKTMLAWQAATQKPTRGGNGKHPPEPVEDTMKGVA